MYTLYTIPGSCSTGIHALLIELNIPYRIVEREDIEDYRALVATNQVPALQVEGHLLTEGSAISLYLLRQYGRQNLTDNQSFLQALMFNYSTLHPAYGKLFSVNGQINDSKEKQAYMHKLAYNVAELWQIIDTQLEGKLYIHNETPTVIDYLLAIYVRWGNVFPTLSIPVGENVLGLVDRVSQLSPFQAAFERENTAYNVPANALAA